MNSLPLSWTINNKFEYTGLVKKKNICWISHASLNDTNNFYRTIDSYIENNSDTDLIIRGCNSSIKNKLAQKGFSSVKIGNEALLDTSKKCFEKKSLKMLVKRGLKNGRVEKLDYSVENSQKLSNFKNISTHSDEPQLKNLFQTEFRSDHSLYVLIQKENWLGAILVSRNSDEKIHTELILRKSSSPVGVLEAIIYQIYSDAKKDNIKYVSLGEVPFSNSIDLFNDHIFTTFVTITGRFFKFAYNYKGLKKFKSKFNTTWEPVYICFSGKISIKHLFFLLFQSNFNKLILFKVLKNITKFYFLPRKIKTHFL